MNKPYTTKNLGNKLNEKLGYTYKSLVNPKKFHNNQFLNLETFVAFKAFNNEY